MEPLTQRDFYPPSIKSIEAYKARIAQRWENVAMYIKRYYTLWSVLLVVGLYSVTQAWV